MIKLSYNKTITFSSVEVGDYAPDPPIFYEVYVNRQERWTDHLIKFMESDFEDIEEALSVIGLQVVSISQGDDQHKIGSKEKAQEILDGFEDKEDGEIFIKRMAIVLYRYILNLEEERLDALKKPSIDSINGNHQESLQLEGKQES